MGSCAANAIIGCVETSAFHLDRRRQLMTATNQALIVETPHGPSLAGTRITVYSVMDYLKGNWSRNFIKRIMLISDEQLDAVLAYVAAHQEEVEQAYARILRREAERRAQAA